MSFPLGEILFLIFLTILEAFFVMAEIALVSPATKSSKGASRKTSVRSNAAIARARSS